MRFHFKDLFSKQRLLNNWGLKITSFILAIVIWSIVVNINDPIISYPYKNVKVTIANENVIRDNGKVYEVLAGSDIVASVSVRAPRSVLRELGTNSDCIVAVADMSKLSLDGTSVPIEFSTNKYNDKVDRFRASSETLSVKIENKKTIQMPITATTSGEIERGYIIGEISPAINQVRISGPESVVDRIRKAAIDVQISGFTDNISTSTDIVLYDEDGEVISKKNLQLNVDNVRVEVEILATKKVPIYYAVMGAPMQGYEATGEVICEPEVVVIAGAESDIATVDNVYIPAAEINITGQTGNLLTSIDLKQFLPRGTRFADNTFNGKANITVFIESLIDESIGVYLRNVAIAGVPEDYTAEFVEQEDYAEFVVSGLAQNIEKIVMGELNIRVDFEEYMSENNLSELKAGTYDLDLSMDLPEGVVLKQPVQIKVKLSE